MSSDLDKLKIALSSLAKLTSLDAILEAFGITTLPMAQRYGILFGCLTFFITLTAVMSLLIFGGTFQRIKDQNESGKATIPDAMTSRSERPLLLETLLEARERMSKSFTEKLISNGEMTPLTKLLIIVSPDLKYLNDSDVSSLIEEDEQKKKANFENLCGSVPPGFEENYLTAYHTILDSPGGPVLPGLPEARFEAYARAYAGCGTYTSLPYRRSYARVYEAIACQNHSTEKKYSTLYKTRPMDLVGRTVRLEPLEIARHVETLFNITYGEAFAENKSFNPYLVWGFLDYGPFENVEQMSLSPIFIRKTDEAAFAIIESVTDRVIGGIILSNNDPRNLTIEMHVPIVKPTSQGSVEQIETCFLLLDKLFALGYRRVELSIDSQDVTSRKLPGRLGFTQEGLLPKHKIVREANRDSAIYGMLNSDWNKGARALLFQKLHGSKAQKIDEANNKKQGEKDEQTRVLQEKKALKDKKIK